MVSPNLFTCIINASAGESNVFVGDRAGTANPGITNAYAIGANTPATDNTFILGNNQMSIGIGMSRGAPRSNLENNSNRIGESGLQFTNLTGQSNASVNPTSKF